MKSEVNHCIFLYLFSKLNHCSKNSLNTSKIFPHNWHILSCSKYIKLIMKTPKRDASSLKQLRLNMKLRRSFNSVTMWVAFLNKMLLCSKTDSHYCSFSILICMSQFFSILWFAECLPATSRHSEIYTGDGFASSGSSRRQRQTAKWCMYHFLDHFLLVLIQNANALQLELVEYISETSIGLARWCNITYQYCYHLNSFLITLSFILNI